MMNMMKKLMMVGLLALDAAAGELPKLEDAKLDTFLTEVYGKRPVERPAELAFSDVYPPETFSRFPEKGIKRKIDAIRRIVICRYRGPYGEGSFRFTVFLPKDASAKRPAPAFLYVSLGYGGGDIDPWRGTQSERWPAEEIVDRGYAAIGFAREEVSPECYDAERAFKEGVFRCFEDPTKPRPPDAWGALSAWAWAASRVMDWIETCPEIDAKHVAVVGHSRGGKTALLAGVTDRRFAMTVSNCSGCGGARLYHVDLPACEHIHQIRSSVSYWFCANYAKWEHRDAEVPFDQHQWLSLVAPRLLYVASGSLDDWAGPSGERLATDLARPAWGARGDADVGYHLREGKHALTAYDWNKFMDFADAHGWRKPAAEQVLPDDKLLEALIRIPSVSTNRMKVAEAVGFLRRQLESRGLFCRTETMSDGRQVLFAANEETKTPDVLLSAHLDVVPAQTPELFDPRWEDGVLYGRGASDCKDHCVLAARLMRELKGKVSVGCLFGSDEEIGGASTAFMLDRGYGAKKLVVVLDAEQYVITTRQRGLAGYRIRATAPAMHTGLVKSGIVPNAVLNLVDGFRALPAALPSGTSASCERISGDRENAEMEVKVRCSDFGDWERVEAALRKTFGNDVTCFRKGDPVILDESAPYLNEFLSRMRKKWPDRKVDFYHMNSTTDARHLQRLGLPMLILGVDARGAHTPSERLIWSSMDEHAELIGAYLSERFAR